MRLLNAGLRFTIEDLNHEIGKKLKKFNERPFAKKPGSIISAGGTRTSPGLFALKSRN